MKKNKILKVILNILIVVAAFVFFLSIVDLGLAIKYANREVEDPAETFRGVMDYEIENRAYGQVLSNYYTDRLYHFDPEPGYEDLYRIAAYGHKAFMARVYDEKGDVAKAAAVREEAQALRGELGDYAFTADEMDEMIENAP